MLFLVENLDGYILIDKKPEKDKILKTTKKYSLRCFYKYKTIQEAIESTRKLTRGKFAKNLQKFLKNSVKKNDLLMVNDIKLKIALNKNLGKYFCNFLK